MSYPFVYAQTELDMGCFYVRLQILEVENPDQYGHALGYVSSKWPMHQ